MVLLTWLRKVCRQLDAAVCEAELWPLVNHASFVVLWLQGGYLVFILPEFSKSVRVTAPETAH